MSCDGAVTGFGTLLVIADDMKAVPDIGRSVARVARSGPAGAIRWIIVRYADGDPARRAQQRGDESDGS